MAKLSLFTRDQSAMDNGIRVEVGPAGQEFGITTRGLTDSYYDRMFALKRQAATEINAALKPGDLPVSPDNLPPSYEDKNMATALVECCLISVDTLEDDDGNAVTFDAFCAMLPQRANQGLLSLAYSAARSVGLVQQAQKDDAVKKLTDALTWFVRDGPIVAQYNGRPIPEYDHNPYPPYVTDAFALDRGLTLTADAMGVSHTAGSVTLANPGGALDSILTTRINDHLPVRISTTAKQWDGVRRIWCDPPGSSLRPVIAGLGKSWRPDRTSVEIDLLDATYWLDGTMPVSVYGGTGRLDGDSNVAGKSMPRMRGSVCNVTPVLIDSVNYVYQISDGPASVSMLYEGGYPGGITFAGTVADIYADSPAPGTYTVQSGTAGTWLRLGTKPVYGITVDAVGTFRSGAAPANVLDILRQMLLEDLVMPAEYIDAGWPATSSLAPWAGGWYWDGSDSVTGQQAATTLLSGLCITLVPTRTGTLLPILLTAPDPSEIPVAELNADLITDISAATLDSSLDPPTWRWRIGWQHNFTVQATGSGLHPQAPADRQAIVAVADRTAVWWSAQIKSHWRVPNDPALITTALACQADAALVAQRHGALWGTQRRLWAVAVPQDLAWGIELGSVVGITAPAAGLTGRQLARVVSEQIRATDQFVTFQILV